MASIRVYSTFQPTEARPDRRRPAPLRDGAQITASPPSEARTSRSRHTARYRAAVVRAGVQAAVGGADATVPERVARQDVRFWL